MRKREVDRRVKQMLSLIKEKVIENEITQTELAKRCGCKQPLISAYLTGAREPGIRNVVKMAMAVGCKWDLKE